MSDARTADLGYAEVAARYPEIPRFILRKIDYVFQYISIRLNYAVIVSTIKVLNISTEMPFLFCILVERSKDSAFKARKTKFISCETI